MEEKTFKNLDGNSLKRRKITILKQVGNVIEADIELAEKPSVEATPITADVMNEFQNKINTAVSTSGAALSASKAAQKKSEDALTASEKANTNSEDAKNLATEANEKATNAERLAADALTQNTKEKGSLVYDGETLIPIFKANEKLNISQGQNNANKVMTTNEDGEIVASSFMQIGEYKIHSEINPETGKKSLIIDIPDEED